MSEDNNNIEILDNEKEQQANNENNQKQAKTKRRDPAWQHFEINTEKKCFTCKLCGKSSRKFKYSTAHPNVIVAKRHLEQSHKTEFKQLPTPEPTPETLKRKIHNDENNSQPKQLKLLIQKEVQKYPKDHAR